MCRYGSECMNVSLYRKGGRTEALERRRRQMDVNGHTVHDPCTRITGHLQQHQHEISDSRREAGRTSHTETYCQGTVWILIPFISITDKNRNRLFRRNHYSLVRS